MSPLAIFALAVGLAMDATAVAAARGLAAERVRPGDAARVAVLFGGFQALMPLFGWLLGRRLGRAVAAWDHWIAFVLLAGIGAKMIHEAATKRAESAPAPATELFRWRVLLVLAVATSIDAFAAGVTLPMLRAPLGASLVTIGLTTATLSTLGLYAGRRFGAVLGRRLDMLGGVLLVLLGSKILVEHLTGRA
jgi:putative Mn2+ efflux pump MntP